MAIQMPQMDGVKATRQLRQQWKNCHILILTTFADDNYVFEGIRAGALSYMLKDVSGDELATAVRTIAAGHSLMNASVAQKVLAKLSQSPSTHPPTLIEPLSERETEILQLIAQGFSNPEIAHQLHLAEGTVKHHR